MGFLSLCFGVRFILKRVSMYSVPHTASLKGRCPTMVTPGSLRFEHHRVALGIGEAPPRLSWKTTAPAGWHQSAYEVQVERGGTVETYRVDSPDSVLVTWPAAPLSSRESA